MNGHRGGGCNGYTSNRACNQVISRMDGSDQPVSMSFSPTTDRARTSSLLSQEAADAIRTANIITTQRLEAIAVCSCPGTMTTAKHLIQYLLAEENCPNITMILFGAHTKAAVDEWKTFPNVVLRAAGPEDDTCGDGCVDLCCTEESLAFATRYTEPLGTLVLLPTAASHGVELLPVDLNAVVINELRVITVGSYEDEVTKTVDPLSTRPTSSLLA